VRCFPLCSESDEEQTFRHLPRRLAAEELLDDGHGVLHGGAGASARDQVAVNQHPVLALAGVLREHADHGRVRRRLLALQHILQVRRTSVTHSQLAQRGVSGP
jgi:hypothetical protein